ncbi:hypothetical protein ACFOSS_10000 [Pseudaeromonas sharmana]|uniref:DUF7939 domain-containing protein n=1 Tax=Pseudaeromonas sharmana TaxID=328412 RepID=A0ABV8CNK8_9GAMM
MVKTLLQLCVLCGCILCQVQASSRVTVDKARLYADESVNLTVIANDRLGVAALDIRPLLRQFIVGEIRYREKSVANALQSIWQIPLIPRQTGTLLIPPLPLANQKTTALPLEVMASPAPAGYGVPPLITVKITPDILYPGAVALYQLEVRQPVGIRLESLTPPQWHDQPLTQVGDDEVEQRSQAGTSYRVLRRYYRLLADTAGSSDIVGPLLQASHTDATTLKSQNFMQQAPTQSLTVRPLPAQAPRLVSRQLSSRVELQPASGPYPAGVPILAIVSWQAIGNTLSQLPAPELPTIPGVRVYLDGVTEQEIIRQGQLVAERSIRYAFIPQDSGRLQIPPSQLSWFNLLSGHSELAQVNYPQLEIADNSSVISSQPLAQPTRSSRAIWPFMAGATLLLGAGVVGYRRYRPNWRALPLYARLHHSVQLRRALRKHDAPATRHALIAWGQIRWPQQSITGIETLPCYRALAAELDALQAACYAGTTLDWNSRALARALRTWRPPRPHNSVKLNPDSVI